MSLRPRLFLALALGLAPTAVIAACSSDTGDNSFGPSFGDLPRRDARIVDGQLIGPDGELLLADGAPVPEEETGPGGCAQGTVAILAGDNTSLSGAVQVRGGAWRGAPIAGGAARSKPALVAFGAGFLGVTDGAGDALQTMTYTTAWSGAAPFGSGGVKGPPSLVVTGTRAQVVYSAGPGADTSFFHGIHDGTSWNAATAKVDVTPPSAPSTASFGTISAGLGAVGNDAVFAENGTNNGLYVRSYSRTWTGADAVFGIGTIGYFPATPEIVAGGSAFDLVLVYSDNDPAKVLAFATRDQGTKVFTNGGPIDPQATTEEKFTVARTANGIVVSYRKEGRGHYVLGTVGTGITWRGSQPFAAANVDSAPAVASGVCGDDAIAAYASGGRIFVTRLRGTTWTAPVVVAGLAGTKVAIATR